MNKLVLIFLFLNWLSIFLNLILFFITFNPPSVVISFLFSGTIHIKLGLNLKAFFTISELVEISRFTNIFFFEQIFFASRSFICLLSSLK